MRVLCTGVPAHGHLFPLLPLARAFRRRGDAVAFLVPEALAPVFAAEDVEVLAAGPDAPTILAEVARRTGVDLLTTPTPEAEIEAFAGVRVDLAAEQSLAVAREWRPDLVVHEPYDFLGPLVAAALAVPAAVVTFGADVSAEFVRPAVATVASRYAARGLAWRPADHVLDTCPAALQWDDWQRPAGWLPMRPLAHRAPDGVLPNRPRPLSGSPGILVTFGTVFTDPVLLSPILRALSAMGAGLRVTLGFTAAATDFDVDHSAVVFEEFLPLDELLRGVDAVVTHGGAGTTMGTLAAGLPLVVTPQGADQSVHAGRAVAAGAAVVLAPDEVTPQSVTEAVRTVLTRPSYRANARRVADQIAALPSPDDVAATLASTLAGALNRT
jgi:UDP:flavonoid glycosyltransferase YjiC (YdhE family)